MRWRRDFLALLAEKFFVWSIALFTVSSFLCGSAWSLQSLVVFEDRQRDRGGGLVPLSQSTLLESFPREKHGMAMAIFGMGTMLGPILGPVLGGWITDTWSWRWIFYINIPISVLSVIMSVIIVDQSTALAFNDALQVIWISALSLLPLVFLMKNPELPGGPPQTTMKE